MTRAVVFAYSEVGVRCLRELLEQEIRVPLVFTHPDDPKESRWFGSVRELAERARGLTRDEDRRVEETGGRGAHSSSSV